MLTPKHFISQITDITKQKKAESQLNLVVQRLSGILEASTQVTIISTDTNGLITSFNKGAENLLQYKAEELVGKQTAGIFHLKEEVEKRGEELSKLEGEKVEGFNVFVNFSKRVKHEAREWTYVRKDGTIFPVLLTITAITESNKIVGYLGIASNIEEIKNTEKELKSLISVTKDQNERLLNFAHIVSHNLRSHSGNFSMILDEKDPEVIAEFTGMLREASNRLEETVLHLNEVVQLNIKTENALVKVNLLNTLNSALSNLAGLIKDSEATVQIDIDKASSIKGVSAYLDSIFLNMLSNAVKYRSKERKLEIKVSAVRENDFWCIIFEDNGTGIDLKKNAAKLFGMYKTFHGNKDARGIGLFITKNQIESMGGKIEVESELNVGSRFKIYLHE